MITNIKTIKDLITIAENINLYETITNENKNRLQKLLPILYKLDSMVGMKQVKENITTQILYYIQRFHLSYQDMVHTCIEGPPGCGKTTLGKILCEIFYELGIVSSKKFVIAKRNDLIAGYLGQTAIKTQKVIDSCKDGVLFLDEVYSLGDKEGRDSFSKECLDTINRNLTENKNNFVCIIAGYKDSIEKCFFSANEGLKRRFPWKYTIDLYNSDELYDIFQLQVRQQGYWIDDKNENYSSNFNKTNDYLKKLLKEKEHTFPFGGGDMENLLSKIKVAHSLRVFFMERQYRKLINYEDIENGYKLYMENKNMPTLDKYETEEYKKNVLYSLYN
jgi:SpoVK/Ycf46/Vps4 family AAA+-type ATPase